MRMITVLVWLFVSEPTRAPSRATDAPTIAWPIGLVMLIMGLVISTQAAFYFWPVQLPFFLGERFELGGSAAGLLALPHHLFFWGIFSHPLSANR